MSNRTLNLDGCSVSPFFLLALSGTPPSQAKQRYTNLQQAFFSGRTTGWFAGPRSVNWIEGGTKFSFIDGQNTIKTLSPKDQKEDVVFDGSQLKFPGTDKPFTYGSFQWSKDSKNILFQANFRPVYRRSGISDYYVYAVADKVLKLVAKDAQTAELAPDGSKIGYERGGNLFIFDFRYPKRNPAYRRCQTRFL